LGALVAFIPTSSATAPEGKRAFRDEKQQRFNANEGGFQFLKVAFTALFY
jgi:hypothetical protein